MKMVNTLLQVIKRKKIALIVSFCNVVVLTIACYVLNNQSIFTGEDLVTHSWLEWIKGESGLSEPPKQQDALFVNVAFDKQLAVRNNKYGMHVGNTDITDRSKLLEFLKILHSANAYKYIIIDVRFEKGYEAIETDSALYAEIGSMDRVVVANHSDMEIASDKLIKKSAISDYQATIVATNFVRYRYSYDGEPSVPLYVYQDLTGHSIKNHGLYYTCEDRLCYNSLFIDFPVEDFDEFDSKGFKRYYNLGSDLLDNYTGRELIAFTKDKIIIIGDMIEDLHDTYSGMKPGPVILFYAFLSLMDGKHYVSYAVLFIFGVTFFVISFSQFGSVSIWEKIPFIKMSHSKMLHFLLSFIEYTFLLAIIAGLLNVLFDITVSIFLPSIFFAIQKNIINYIRK